MRAKPNCSVCGGQNLAKVLDLPRLPITGIYVSAPCPDKHPGLDQGLMLCRDCGHGQLEQIIEPSLIYDNTYKQRTAISPISKGGNDFFAKFLEEVTDAKKFKQIVEIGCNDLYLLSKIQHKAERLAGIDPLWKTERPQAPEKIQVIGTFIEDVDFSRDLPAAPDLIISAHTFEHVDSPREQLAKLVSVAAPEALFIIETPSFDTLLTNCRIDQIFHQHIQYYSLASMARMVKEIGCEYVTHTFNYEYWGGTMLMVFRKSSRPAARDFPKPTEKRFAQSLQVFRQEIASLMQIIETLAGEPMFGYGAAQMLPIVAYHMHSNLSFLKCVWDDNPDRTDLTWPDLSVMIRRPDANLSLEGATVLVTAMDSLRPILKRVMPLKPKHILVPLNTF